MNVFDEIKAGQTKDKIQKSINLDKLGCDAKQFFTKGEIEMIEKAMTKPISEDIQKSMDLIEKALEIGLLSDEDIQKAKYIRREGTKGNYKYIYDEPKGGGKVEAKKQRYEKSKKEYEKFISNGGDKDSEQGKWLKKNNENHKKSFDLESNSKKEEKPEMMDFRKEAGLPPKEDKKKEGYDSTFELNGKTYQTKGFTSEEAANKFMEANKDYGLIGIKKQQVLGKDEKFYHVAKDTDEGGNKTEPSKLSIKELESKKANEISFKDFLRLKGSKGEFNGSESEKDSLRRFWESKQ